jgi:hypothetical protein
MTTRTTTANGRTKADAGYLARIDECLRQIKAIHKAIVQERASGRKVTARIDRNIEEIQIIIGRVEATFWVRPPTPVSGGGNEEKPARPRGIADPCRTAC